MLEQLETYDWREAFYFAHTPRAAVVVDKDLSLTRFERDDVKAILGVSEGQNEGDPWIMLGQLNDGRFFFLNAWCDFTGWDCQAGGEAYVAETLYDAVCFACTPSELHRMFGTEDIQQVIEKVVI